MDGENDNFIFCVFVPTQLIRSKVATGKVEGGEVENIRTSKIAWLEEQADPTVSNILRRIADMTSLTMEAAEMLQVCNYGLGGHYVPHVDYFEVNFQFCLEK